MTWMVTGGSGFLGGFVLRALRDRGERVVAFGRRPPPGWPRDSFLTGHLDDRGTIADAVARIRPDLVIHAAGKTPPAPAHELYLANTRATRYLLEALEASGHPCRVVLAGSAAELGRVPEERLPVGEDHPCSASDPYGLSKWAATRLGLMAEPPLDVMIARIFNPIGPGLPRSQAFGRFAAILADPSRDPSPMKVGGLDARRDFLDVRDVASALIALAIAGRPRTVYHVGMGTSRTIGEGLRELVRLSGRRVEIQADGPARGPLDSRAAIGRIREDTGWAPRFPWETSLRDLWDEAVGRAFADRVA